MQNTVMSAGCEVKLLQRLQPRHAATRTPGPCTRGHSSQLGRRCCHVVPAKLVGILMVTLSTHISCTRPLVLPGRNAQATNEARRSLATRHASAAEPMAGKHALKQGWHLVLKAVSCDTHLPKDGGMDWGNQGAGAPGNIIYSVQHSWDAAKTCQHDIGRHIPDVLNQAASPQ